MYLLCSPWRRSNLDETCRSYTELRLVLCDVLCAAVGLHCGMAMNLGSLNHRLLPDHLTGNSSVQLGGAASFTSSFITYQHFCYSTSDAWQRCIPHLEEACQMTVTVCQNFPRFSSVMSADWTLDTCVAWRSWIRASWYKYENNQQDALYRLIYYSKSDLLVPGDVFAHHQEHLIVFTVSGSVYPSCCRLQLAATSLTETSLCGAYLCT